LFHFFSWRPDASVQKDSQLGAWFLHRKKTVELVTQQSVPLSVHSQHTPPMVVAGAVVLEVESALMKLFCTPTVTNYKTQVDQLSYSKKFYKHSQI